MGRKRTVGKTWKLGTKASDSFERVVMDALADNIARDMDRLIISDARRVGRLLRRADRVRVGKTTLGALARLLYAAMRIRHGCRMRRPLQQAIFDELVKAELR